MKSMNILHGELLRDKGDWVSVVQAITAVLKRGVQHINN